MITSWAGTWQNITGQDLAAELADALEGVTPTQESRDAIERAYRAAIGEVLPDWWYLAGEDLIGPADGDLAPVRTALREWLATDAPAVWVRILARHLVEADDEDTASDMASADLPTGIHHQVLRGTDPMGTAVEAHIVWAERTEDHCPRCHQPVDVDPGCPAVLDAKACQGGQVLTRDMAHQCGEWLSVPWAAVEGPGDIAETAAQLAAERESAAAAAVEAIRDALRVDLRDALARLGEPLEDGETRDDREDEVATGSEMYPGVWQSSPGVWEAWAPLPIEAEGECVIVTPEDL